MEYKLALNLGIKSDLDNPVELYLTMKKFSLLWSPIETKLLEIENKAIEGKVQNKAPQCSGIQILFVSFGTIFSRLVFKY